MLKGDCMFQLKGGNTLPLHHTSNNITLKRTHINVNNVACPLLVTLKCDHVVCIMWCPGQNKKLEPLSSVDVVKDD
jgi:hypothetical protein